MWRRWEFLHLRLHTIPQPVMDVMFPLEVFVYDSHYPFLHISPVHRALLRNGAVVCTQNWFIHLSVMEFFWWVLFCLGPCLFPTLTSGSNAEWDVIPKHNEVPVTAWQPATCLLWHLLEVLPLWHRKPLQGQSHVFHCLEATCSEVSFTWSSGFSLKTGIF